MGAAPRRRRAGLAPGDRHARHHAGGGGKLAAFKGREAALLFSSGFQANATVMPALARVGAAIRRTPRQMRRRFSATNSTTPASSTARAPRAARSGLSPQRPRPPRCLLGRHAGPQADRHRVGVQHGRRSRRPGGAGALAERHGALLYVDEAHATGILGPQGRGLAAGCEGVDVVMGTLGKAFGAFGAYVAGSRALIDWLVNRCSGFIFTTALPPPVLGAVDAALDLLPGMDAERARVAAHAQRLREALAALGISTLESSTQIVPAVIGAETDTLAAAAALEAAGILAVAIRPPTVAPGSSRLRLAINSGLGEAEIAACWRPCLP
jgi:8-amino-7-oxononanoate synthase